MRIRVEIGTDKLILLNPSEAVQQLVVAKFFSYCRDANVSASLQVKTQAESNQR